MRLLITRLDMNHLGNQPMKPDFATTEFLIQLHKWKELSKNDILPFSSITEENRNTHIFYDDSTPSFIDKDITKYNIVRNFVFVTDALAGETKKEVFRYKETRI